jgi:hypothetical protein
MAMHDKDALIEIIFPNGHSARALIPAPETSPAQMLQALGIERPKALILIAGGAGRLDREMAADEALRDRLVDLFSQGIACAAVEAGALIVDGGTDSGVMALMGRGVAGYLYRVPLLGVSPVGRVTYPGGPAEDSIESGGPLDSHHTHFVLAGEDWGDETETMYALADALVGTVDPIPVVTVAVHGNVEGIARNEVMQNVRRGWPILAVDGSGGLASELARLKSGSQRRCMPRLWRTKGDREMDQIIAQGRIEVVAESATAQELAQAIGRYLQTNGA